MKGIILPHSIRSGRGLLIAGAAAAAIGGGASAELRAQQAGESVQQTPAIAAEELNESIRQLDDDEYAVRQAAQRKLTQLGMPALELTAQAAATGSLESSTRAVNILWKWADSNDASLNQLALAKLAELTNRPVEAAEAQRRLAVLREAVAMKAIVELGGRVDADRSFGMMGGNAGPLQVMIGKDWRGGVDGLKHVADIRRATTLSLWSAPLGDEVLPQLEELGHVRRLELYGLELTPERVEQSRQKLPNTMVEVRGPARLGIRGLDAIEIVPNSPAAKAGLVVHDRIIEFAGQKIETFEQLTAEIGKCDAGDTVDVKFIRGTETRDAKVTFDAWGDDLGAPPVQPNVPPAAQGLFGPIPRAVPAGPLQRLPIERRPLEVPRANPPQRADPALPR
jgi:hypothetical protein